jgi:hypothetical protein
MERTRISGQIGVVGGSSCTAEIYALAREVGGRIATLGYALVCGGRGGVMEAACRGAKDAGGMTIGILPSVDKGDANPYVDVVILTGLGHARNVVVVHSSDALIAVGGQMGTLSEIAIGLKVGKPVIGVRTWNIEGMTLTTEDPAEAVDVAVEKLL